MRELLYIRVLVITRFHYLILTPDAFLPVGRAQLLLVQKVLFYLIQKYVNYYLKLSLSGGIFGPGNDISMYL